VIADGSAQGSGEELVASGVRSVPFARFQLGLWALLLVLWGWQALTERRPHQVLMAVLAAVALVGYVWLAVAGTRTALVLHDERLELRRRRRPLAIARADVVGVKGDVPGRPTWSEGVVVVTRTGEVRLPALDRPPGDVIVRLQRWAGVGEGEGPPA
jgi:hypothetical protein